MLQIKNLLSGRKTYIVSTLMIIIGLVNFLTGDITLVEFLNTDDIVIILNGLGLGFLRAGVDKA